MNQSLFRNCPACTTRIEYKNPTSHKKSLQDNKPCRSCTQKEIQTRPGRKDAFIAKFATKGKRCGHDNPFFGQTHTDETKAKLRLIKKADHPSYHTPEFLNTMSEISSGTRNPMFGKSIYDHWRSQYAPEEVERRIAQHKARISASTSGPLSNRFGKPPPVGSGNGWSGWYKSWYFRSLKELSYMINVIEAQNLPWQTGETLRIPYLNWDGTPKTYSPDFLISGNRLVEVKPTKLKSSPSVRLKQAAAEAHCKIVGWAYEIVDPPQLGDQKIKELHEQKLIRFIDRYERKFQERYNHG